MYARATLIRGTGLFAFSLSLFYGCGGLNEADVTTSTSGSRDAGADAISELCGNGDVDPGEDCDGKNLNGQTCESVMLGSGRGKTLRCTARCTFDAKSCGGGNGGNGGQGQGGTGGGTGGGFGTGGRLGGTGGSPNPGTGGGPNPGTGGGPSTGGVQCTSDADCTGNEVCCGIRTNGQLTSFECRANTCGQTNFATECAKASDCGGGQVCCGTLTANGNSYTGIACAATCGQNGRNEIILCTSNQECGQGTTCQTSRLLPTDFRVCR